MKAMKWICERKLLKMIKNWFTTMTNEDPDLGKPEEIRDYLKSNMAEGYLSESEGLNIDEFVDRYEELLDQNENLEQVVRKAFEDKVK